MAQSGCLWGRLVARLAPAAVDTPGIGPALPALAAEQARMMAVPVTGVVAVEAHQMGSTHYLLVVHR
jgi:hypothetical protein